MEFLFCITLIFFDRYVETFQYLPADYIRESLVVNLSELEHRWLFRDRQAPKDGPQLDFWSLLSPLGVDRSSLEKENFAL